MRPLAWQAELVRVGLPALLDVRAGAAPWAISIPTGGGKTYGAALLLRALRDAGEMPARVVVVTPRLRLVDDIRAALGIVFSSPEIGVVSGEEKDFRRITVTTYASLGTVIERWGCDLLVCDEAHRSSGDQADRLVRSIPWRVGLSATLYRGDNNKIAGFERVLMRVTWDEATANGWIVPYDHRVLGVATWARIGGADDPEVSALHGALAMIEEAGGARAIGPGLMTAPDGATARRMAQIATDAGLRTAAVDYQQSEREQDATIEDLRYGRLDAIVTVTLLTEGVDLPWLRWIALTASCGSDVLLAQFIGRAVRALRFDRFPEQAHLGEKKAAIVFDPGHQFHPARLGKEAALGYGGEVLRPLPRSPEKRAAACIARLEKLPENVAVEPLDQWSVALRDHALARAGAAWRTLPGARIITSPAERALFTPPAWWREIEKLWKPARLFVFPHRQREAIGLLIERAIAGWSVPRGVVADLGIFLRWAASRAKLGREQARAVAERLSGPARYAAAARVRDPYLIRLPEDLPIPGETAAEAMDDE